MIILSDDVENDKSAHVNMWLIIINSVIAVWSMIDPSSLSPQWAVVPRRFLTHQDLTQILTIFSSMFMHADFLHLAGNIWILFLFGDNVEDRLGHFTYLIFYLTVGFISAVVFILSNQTSNIPLVGASGAIAGVMAAYISIYPKASCNTWWGDDSLWLSFRTFKIPAILVIGLWFALQVVLGILVPQDVGGIAYLGHIGGFLAGLSLMFFLNYRDRNGDMQRTEGTSRLVSIIALVSLVLLTYAFVSPASPDSPSSLADVSSESASPATTITTPRHVSSAKRKNPQHRKHQTAGSARKEKLQMHRHSQP